MLEIGVGWNFDTVIVQMVEIVMPGVGKTRCWECGGDGDWSKFYPDPSLFVGRDRDCVECKGTGIRYVDAWALPR